MTSTLNQIEEQIKQDGYAVVRVVFSAERMRQIVSEIEFAFEQHENQANLRTSRQTVFAARNLIDLLPKLDDYWQQPVLLDLLERILGPKFGLVRVLYFDKPSHRSWTLPWHKDMTIAVKDNRRGGNLFSKPTTKAGVPHVEGSLAVLQNMLTLRIHLDEVTNDNGPLKVIPGSHLSGKQVDSASNRVDTILASAGDVLAMRPLLSHSSGHSDPEKEMHRRILHLEFSGQPELPDGYQWQWFEPAK